MVGSITEGMCINKQDASAVSPHCARTFSDQLQYVGMSDTASDEYRYEDCGADYATFDQASDSDFDGSAGNVNIALIAGLAAGGGALLIGIIVGVYCICANQNQSAAHARSPKPMVQSSATAMPAAVPMQDSGLVMGAPMGPAVQMMPASPPVVVPMAAAAPVGGGNKFDPQTGAPLPKFDAQTGKQNWW